MDNKSVRKFRDELLEKLPAIVTRKQALAATGNMFSPRRYPIWRVATKDQGQR